MGRIISRRDVFLAGMIGLPAYLFLNRVELVAPLAVLYLALMLLSGRSFRLLFPVVATAGIVTANLLAPSGRILFSVGPLSITTGALEIGLRKSLTFVGLVYLSYVAVRPGLSLPGGFGVLFARVIYYFERLLEADKVFDPRQPIRSLDVYLWAVFPPESVARRAPPAALTGPSRLDATGVVTRTSAVGWGAAALVALPPWAALVAQLFWQVPSA
jgi:hypothetical protein